jgi:hypothetical protein
MSDTVKEAGVLWTVRLMRVQGGELSVQSVYNKQASIFHYSYDEVSQALREIGNKGYHWSQRYQGIPDTCILVGAHQWQEVK